MTRSTPDGMEVNYDILILGEEGLELGGRLDVGDAGHFVLFVCGSLGN